MKYNKAFIAAAVLALSAGYANAAFDCHTVLRNNPTSGLPADIHGCDPCMDPSLQCPDRASTDYICEPITFVGGVCKPSPGFGEMCPADKEEITFTTGVVKCIDTAVLTPERDACLISKTGGPAKLVDAKCTCDANNAAPDSNGECPCLAKTDTVITKGGQKTCVDKALYDAQVANCGRFPSDAEMVDDKCVCKLEKTKVLDTNVGCPCAAGQLHNANKQCVVDACAPANRKPGAAGSDPADIKLCGTCLSDNRCKMTADNNAKDYKCTEEIKDDHFKACHSADPWYACEEGYDYDTVSKACLINADYATAMTACAVAAKVKFGNEVFADPKNGNKWTCGCKHGADQSQANVCACEKAEEARDENGACVAKTQADQNTAQTNTTTLNDQTQNTNQNQNTNAVVTEVEMDAEKCKKLNRKVQGNKCGGCNDKYAFEKETPDMTKDACYPQVEEAKCTAKTREFNKKTGLCTCKKDHHPAEQGDVSSNKECSGAAQTILSSSVLLLSVAASALFFF